jgi:drug/metabolite transporter (DMT)-like permease
MAEYFAFQAALCFSIAHVFVRRGFGKFQRAHRLPYFTRHQRCDFLAAGAGLGSVINTAGAPGVGYFIAAGVFAPAIGRTLGYVGMEKIGVARSAPIVNTSPIFSSIFAVSILGEVWTRQNMLGTCLVILGSIVLSSSKPAAGEWRRKDIIYPLLGAVAFGVSTTLRKSGS